MKWEACPRFPRYEVSEFGDVRVRSNGKRLRGFIDPDGYIRYAIIDKGGIKRSPGAHQLVAEAYLPAMNDGKLEVAHSNGSRLHNHYSNLRWASSAENQADTVIHGSSRAGEMNGRARLTAEDIRQIRHDYREIKMPGSGRSVAELDRKYGLCRAHILRIAKGKAWKHIALILTSLFLINNKSEASDLTTSRILQGCKSQNIWDDGFCRGFVYGIFAANGCGEATIGEVTSNIDIYLQGRLSNALSTGNVDAFRAMDRYPGSAIHVAVKVLYPCN